MVPRRPIGWPFGGTEANARYAIRETWSKERHDETVATLLRSLPAGSSRTVQDLVSKTGIVEGSVVSALTSLVDAGEIHAVMLRRPGGSQLPGYYRPDSQTP